MEKQDKIKTNFDPRNETKTKVETLNTTLKILLMMASKTFKIFQNNIIERDSLFPKTIILNACH